MKINRRHFINTLGVSTAALSVSPISTLTSCQSAPSAKEDENDGPQIQIGENIAVVQTSYGKVKGYISKDIYTFLGIPYGASTTGKNRFMPPQKPEPWEGVRPVVFYGNSAPQEVYSRASTSYDMFIDQWNYDEISEDCLSINVWSPNPYDGKKRPVLVWLHGGGFSRGNGIEQNGYHGENITRYGDVVYCSLNHRLGVFGFSDFSGVGGEKYKDSGNVGVLDMVAALQWIHDNIANFGGDPDNVTILGQSGGGAKVCILAAMPENKRLIHKALSLSGSATNGNNPEYSRKLGEYIVREAGLTPSQVDKLQEIPWERYMDIAYKAAARLEKETGGSGMPRGSFGPIADGLHIPSGQFFTGADAPDVPMIFCTTFHEHSASRTNPELENITIQGVIDRLKGRYRERTETIVKAYAENFPKAKPIELLCLISSTRESVVETATVKSQQRSPIYMAWFGWCPPLFDNRMRAFHCLDISFWFLNTDRINTHTGGGTRPRKLSYKMADALLSFVRTGNPNCNSLPSWPAFTVENGETMILNDICEVKNDPDRKARQTLKI